MSLQMRHAVICPGHAVFLGGDPTADSSWVLEPFQEGEPPFYLEHLRRAIELTAADESALLILSGGQTRPQAGPRSEAESYLEAAEILHWFGQSAVRERTTLEEFARDSFENLLFGICRFREFTGAFPQHVTVTGWTFKHDRFHLHREALAWPPDRFTYLGLNQPPQLAVALAGEQSTADEFRRDPLGRAERMRSHRARRNPFGRQHPYAQSCPEMLPFLDTITLTTETAT